MRAQSPTFTGLALANLHKRLQAIEALIAPVLWICYNNHCGAPNETPLIQFVVGNHINPNLQCDVCHYVQHTKYLEQFFIQSK